MACLVKKQIPRAAVLTLALILGGCGRMGCGRSQRTGPPYRPDEALKTFKLEKGFRIERFAAEPLITGPVSMEFDEYGRIFVVEMPGYPLDTTGTGRVILLEDTNGDGIPDRRTVFADKLVLPTSVMRWKKGILVTDPPNVWYFEDTDGDNQADVRRIVLTGFAFTNPQHTANGLLYGLDNQIYLANEPPVTAVVFKEQFGDRGRAIHFPDRPDIPALDVQGRNVRFRPDTYQLEALSGSSQFGHTFDEWGRRFTLNNSNHVRHEVIAARYLKRNPDLLLPTAMHNMSDHGAAAEVFPITQNPQYQILTDVGRITSACGLTLYLGGAFPPSIRRSSFVAEPAHNLVHRDVWSDAGPAFIARRAADKVEFLASTDSWFRPVNFYIGPDGALYLLDFYRQIIEHPEWMARAVYESQDLYNGADKGRIYRIVPEPAPPLPRNIRLGDASDAELVRQLASPNIWWRRTAQRLLVDRQSAGAVAPLVRLFKESPSPIARVHSLWTLEGLGKLERPLIQAALDDPEPGVRENAIQMAEARMATTPALVEKLLSMADDPDAKVRFQLLYTLGYIDSPPARAVRERLLFENIEEPWMAIAALSASSSEALPLLEKAVTRLTDKKTTSRMQFFRQVASIIAARQQASEVQRVLKAVTQSPSEDADWWSTACLEGLAAGGRGKKTAGETLKIGRSTLLALVNHHAAAIRRAALPLLETAGLTSDAASAEALRRAATTAAQRQADPDTRADAIRLLTLADPANQVALFKQLVEPQEPEPVRVAAVRALGRIPGDEMGRFLLGKWRTMTLAVRNEAADALFREPGRVRLLLNALKRGEVQGWMLGANHRRQFIMYDDPALREEARAVLAEQAGDRKKVVKRYEASLHMDGDAGRGAQVFKNVCARCHQMDGAGGRLGPDLATVRNRTPEALLTDILIPSQSIAQNYETYVIRMVNGGTIEGVIGTETPTTITLRHENGTEDVIPRDNIKEMVVSPISAMPEDLDKQISVQQMADLLKFLKTAR